VKSHDLSRRARRLVYKRGQTGFHQKTGTMPTRDELFALKERVRDEIPRGVVFFLKGEDGSEDYMMDNVDAAMLIPFALMLQCGGVVVVGSIPQDEEGVYLFLDNLDDFPSGLLVEVLTPTAGTRGSHTALFINGFTDTDGVPVTLEGWKMARVPSVTNGSTHVGAFKLSSCNNAFVVIKHLVMKCFWMARGEPFGAAAGDM
jgi:hypothetical protein